MKFNQLHRCVIIGWLALFFSGAGQSVYGQVGTYMTSSQFLKEGFGGTPAAGTYSLTASDQTAAKAILGHGYQSRVRYWKSGNKTGWILDKVGKHKPITTGFVVDGGKISLVRVLVYRETQGGEVKNSFFTRQFKGAKLKDPPRYDLSKRIGNISGATMSVNSLRKLSRFALYLDSRVAK